MVQGVLLALGFDLYYQEVITYSPTELTAMIKASRNEAEIKPNDEAKKVSRKLISKLYSVINARSYKVPEMLLQLSILAQYCNFIMYTQRTALECP